MNEYLASRTALITSLMRALHTRLDPAPLINDLWADRLVPQAARDSLRQLAVGHLDPEILERLSAAGSRDPVLDTALRARATYAGVIIRTRYSEDALQAAVRRGVRQYLIIGAGFDSFSLRQPAFARDLEVYEIDHPATQDLKRRRLDECGIKLPNNVHLISADLANEALGSVLARSPFRTNETAFVSLLGVTLYLARETNLATFRAIASSTAPGSELVFTYVEQSEFEANRTSGSFGKVQTSAAALGEPWVSGFEPARLAEDLHGTGLNLLEDLNGAQMRARYGQGRVDNLRPEPTAHIARAQVAGKLN